MSPARVLIVDDDALGRAHLADTLKVAGHRVECAEDGESALRRLEAEDGDFAVLVTDLRMPGMDGVELIGRAKALRPEMDALVVTAVDSVPAAVRAMRAGALHYVVKPVDAEALRIEVARCLERQALAASLAGWRRHAELLEVSRRLAGELDPDQLRRLTVDSVMGAVAANAGLLVEVVNGAPRVHTRRGVDPAQAESLADALGSGLLGALAGGPRRVAGRRPGAYPGRAHALFVPLGVEEAPRAAVALLRRPTATPFSVQDERDAAFLVQCVTDALRNADRFADVRRQVLTDGLTGLGNAGRLDAWLVDCHGRTEGHPFGLLFLDLDRFKSVNDTHGHRAGSRLLAGFARLFAAALPEAELLVRYGGDEFVAVIPGDRRQVTAAADRLVRRLRRHEFPGGIKISASVGVAVWPDDNPDPETVLELADQALYARKRGGRDGVTVNPSPVLPV